MSIRTTFPREVRTLDDVWIAMSDGCRLSARIWLPEDADDLPVPAILEYIPYRKNDATAPRDSRVHPYLAGHGYASVRVDIRGSGDSEGVMEDEYTPQELDDALEVISWLAAQPWCSGRVGMIGISWGGFNGLQVAALRPPELGAVVSICSTDDRYADDVHYRGGCLLGSDMLPWSATMLAYNARPPDPSRFGEGWRDLWHERLEAGPFVERWLEHQRRDTYWKHGSVSEDYDAIEVPVYMVGGWFDPYHDAVLRFLAGHDGPRKGLIGPWGHVYPHEGAPGPAIGFLQECLRFFDTHLKGEETSIMEEPMLRAFLLDPTSESGETDGSEGLWVTEDVWPSPNVRTERYTLGVQTLGEEQPEERRLTLRGAQTAGLEAGAFLGKGFSADLPLDQRREDGLSLCFTSAPLAEPLQVLGSPEAILELSVDRPLALVATRLTEVKPSGASQLVARGFLNLTHRVSHEHPEPLEPGRRYTVTVRLSSAGHVFSAGSRIRLSVSPTYWPWAWPSPEPVMLEIHTGGASALCLPVRTPQPRDGEGALAPPEEAAPLQVRMGREPQHQREVRWDVGEQRAELTHRQGAEIILPDGLRMAHALEDRFAIREGEPLSAQVISERRISLSREGWRSRVEVRSTMSADADSFHVTNVLDAYEGEVRIFARTWSRRVPRDHV